MRRTDHVHPAFTLQVTFVSDQYDGDRLRIFDSQDLLMVRLYHFERVSLRDGVNEEEALAVEHVVFPHRTVWAFQCKANNPTIVKEGKMTRQLPQNREDRSTKTGQKKKVG